LTNRPCADLVRGRPLVRDAQTSAPGSRAGVRLGPVRVPRTMLPGGCGPRRVAPVRRAGRSASTLPLNRPPRPGWPSRAADGYRGVAYEHRWQADALGRGRGRPLSGGQGLEPAPPAARHAHLPPRGKTMHAGAAHLREARAAPGYERRGHVPSLRSVSDQQPRFVTPRARTGAGTTPTGSPATPRSTPARCPDAPPPLAATAAGQQERSLSAGMQVRLWAAGESACRPGSVTPGS
jgi:hypothetical protein